MEVSVAPRAVWKGTLKVAEVVCPVSMYTAASTSQRISLHMVNRKTGNRLRRVYADVRTDEVVEKEDQVKGYETDQDQYIILEPEEIAAAVPDSDKTLSVESFIPCRNIEPTYFDKPYYLLPSNDVAQETFILLREALRKQKVAAIATAVLFRRVRPVLIRAHRKGLIATTLNFDYEVRSATDAFKDISKRTIDAEMLELAQHIINTKAGNFDPEHFDDRYEQALADLVKAKIDGRKVVPLKRPEPTKSNDLLEALRQSAGTSGTGRKSAKGKSAAAKSTPAEKQKKAS